MNKLNVNGVNLFARATDHVDEILDQIQRLIDKGFAYETEDGVYFEIDKFPEFGKLSNRNVEELESHRDLADTTKRNPQDFALWKKRVGVDEPSGRLLGVTEDRDGTLKIQQSLSTTSDRNMMPMVEVLT